MKAYFLKAGFILLLVILALGPILIGHKNETPPPKELTAKEKEFLSVPDVVTCELEKIEISKLNLPKGPVASNFFQYMESQNRHYVKQGRITLANRPFIIVLGFHPEREFYIFDIKKGFNPYWPGYTSLHSYHKIDDKLYEFMLIDQDTKIAARPYKGPLGIIKFGKGDRDLEKVKFSGSLKKDDNIPVPVGNIIKQNWPNDVTECPIPVGDYAIYDMYVTYDNLLIRISGNSTKKSIYPINNNTVYGIHVRQDKPFILNFSNEPTVLFSLPSMSKTTFLRGDVIEFTTILIDPKLDIKIETLYDTSIKVNKQYTGRDGMVHTFNVNKSLDPNIVIARADGEVIAEVVHNTYGNMWWRVPDDLQINGDEEELTATMTYDTQKLYGTVNTQQKIKIRK